ncbi:MAG TPA: dephospho-CoA kinase [Candidatus Limnocylindrales bacterium]|nr:dephospho-CoA kinase [Candidatus Limnocylindrales bacterium]
MSTETALRIGLTGPIGCGKSSVARWLADAGGRVIDADVEARAVTAPGSAVLAAIADRFGSSVITADGQLDRAALAAIVFSDAAALADLERIVHPAVRERILAALAEAEAAGVPFVVIEAIKLIEGGLARDCHEVWLVECSPANQLGRLRARGFTESDIERRLAAQGADFAERHAAAATRRIRTDGSMAQTREAVEDALRAALAAAWETSPRPTP